VKQFSLLSRRVAALFLTPGAILVGLFVLLPFFWVIFVSFTNRTLLGKTALNPEFVGLQNYIRLFDPATFFTRGQFGSSLIITTEFVLLSALLGQALLGLLLAWLMQAIPAPLKRFVEAMVIGAWILPEVVIGFAWFAFLDYDNGTLNMILRALGLPPGDFLLQQPFWVIVIFNTWRGAAFSMMLFNSAFSSIPPSYFQAADVAGASSWQKFRDIALPLIRGHVVTDLILITMWTFNVFTPFLLTHGGPAYKTELLSIYNYRVAFKDFEFGKGAAVGVIIMLINLILALIYLSIGRRKSKAEKEAAAS
jgi:multiple sugar transport system permease protein